MVAVLSRARGSLLAAIVGLTASTSPSVTFAQPDPISAIHPLQVYMRGQDNNLYAYYLNDGSQAWDYWESLQRVSNEGGRMRSAPAAETFDGWRWGVRSREMHVVYRRDDNHIVDVRYSNARGTWESADVGCCTSDAPALVYVNDEQDPLANRFAMFFRGTDNNLYVRAEGIVTQYWSDWGPIVQLTFDGSVASAPSVTRHTGTVDVVYRRSDGRVAQGWCNVATHAGAILNVSNWTFMDLGAFYTASAPAGVAYPAYPASGSNYYVFVRGLDDRLYMRVFQNGAWGGWTETRPAVGATVQSAPSAAVRPARYAGGTPQLHVVWRNANSQIGHVWYESQWSSDTVGCCTDDALGAVMNPF